MILLTALPFIRPSSLFATSFGEYPTGAAPADWTKQYNTGGFSVSVESVAGSISGKALRWTKTTANRQGLSWNRIPLAADVEILLRARTIEAASSTENLIAAYCRGAGSAGAEDGYRTVASATATSTLWGLASTRYIAGTLTTPVAQVSGPSPNFASNTWFYIRFRMVGTSFQSKLWYSGSAEPGSWTLSATDGGLSAAGWTGLHQVSINPDTEIDFFAASIAQGANPPATIPVPV